MSKASAFSLIFKQFVATGQLGPIKCGITKQNAEQCLGRPEVIKDYPDDKSVWCYWPAELRFSQEIIDAFSLGFEWWNGNLPDWLRSEGRFPAKGTNMATIRSFLKESSISFEVGRDGKMLRTSAGVWILPTPEDTMMTASKECGGSWSFFDEQFRHRSR